MMQPTMPMAASMAKTDDEVGAEPIVLLPLVQHDLQAAQAQGDQAEADVIDFQPVFQTCLLFLFGVASESCTSRWVRNSERMPTGMLMKKIQRQV